MKLIFSIFLLIISTTIYAEPQCDNPEDAKLFKEHCKRQKMQIEHDSLYNEVNILIDNRITKGNKHKRELAEIKSSFIKYIKLANEYGGLQCFFITREGLIPEGQGAGGAPNGQWCEDLRLKERIKFMNEIKKSCLKEYAPCFTM